MQRSTSTRDRHRTLIARGRPPCGICGGDIDYSLPHLDPGEYVIDHIVPLARGGADTLDNLQPAHRHCNRQKADKDPDTAPRPAYRTFVTDRTW
ncbi:HNH endonuclease [Nocardia flavorosea]|uniref:HNH endonuclease signature motif containing protein n=1 Tax=Nocardia flavorosea TaxID=53429 RepID=UPI0018960EF8|nr:HNH endonuclease signature motif containing protein [Nocardia flavorosea]MBF6350348.1 HNH endonuclease [Nocardia flavorosea]